jgi:OOP family OmpA-OmpF porin
VGAAYTRARADFGGTASTARRWGPKVGLGVEYAFTPQLAVRGEWERYRVHDPVRGRGDIDVASIGLVYRFGAPAPVRVVAPAPAPAVIPAPAPAPRVIAPAPAPEVAPPPPPPPPPPPAPAVRPYRN